MLVLEVIRTSLNLRLIITRIRKLFLGKGRGDWPSKASLVSI